MLVSEDRAFAFMASLEQQLAEYRRVLELSSEQDSLIAGGRQADLLGVLGQKQSCLERIDRLSAEFAEERRLLEKAGKGAFSVIDSEIALILDELAAVLRRITEIEDRDVGLLRGLHESESGQIKRLRTGKHLARAYRALGSAGNMDRKG